MGTHTYKEGDIIELAGSLDERPRTIDEDSMGPLIGEVTWVWSFRETYTLKLLNKKHKGTETIRLNEWKKHRKLPIEEGVAWTL